MKFTDEDVQAMMNVVNHFRTLGNGTIVIRSARVELTSGTEFTISYVDKYDEFKLKVKS